MDTDFINKYVQKQSQLITELTNKNLMVEVKLQIMEERYASLVSQHNALVESVELARQQAEAAAAKSNKSQRAQKLSPPQPPEPDLNQHPESQF